MVAAGAAASAALALLREMHAASLRAEPAMHVAAEEPQRPIDLWDPDQQLQRMRDT